MKFLSKLFPKRSKSIQITNLNDAYLQIQADTFNALGQDYSVRADRKRNPNLVFVIDFHGDVMASEAGGMAQEIGAILSVANAQFDEVLIRVESAGGAVHSYGYAASQIQRLLDARIKTTISVDKIAASGGYMMACVADKIIAAPFAIVGSIGVVAELPNVSRLIKQIGVDYKQYTAGKFKRTVGTFTPITEEAEAKFNLDLQSTFQLFKEHILKFRPQTKIEEVATGEHWYGSQAFKLGLVDGIQTSDEFITEKIKTAEVLKVSYIAHKTWSERIQSGAVSIFEGLIVRVYSLYAQAKYF